jgi:hypothetical protein
MHYVFSTKIMLNNYISLQYDFPQGNPTENNHTFILPDTHRILGWRKCWAFTREWHFWVIMFTGTMLWPSRGWTTLEHVTVAVSLFLLPISLCNRNPVNLF